MEKKRNKIREVFGDISIEEEERLRKMDLPLGDVVGRREVTKEEHQRAIRLLKRRGILSEDYPED